MNTQKYKKLRTKFCKLVLLLPIYSCVLSLSTDCLATANALDSVQNYLIASDSAQLSSENKLQVTGVPFLKDLEARYSAEEARFDRKYALRFSIRGFTENRIVKNFSTELKNEYAYAKAAELNLVRAYRQANIVQFWNRLRQVKLKTRLQTVLERRLKASRATNRGETLVETVKQERELFKLIQEISALETAISANQEELSLPSSVVSELAQRTNLMDPSEIQNFFDKLSKSEDYKTIARLEANTKVALANAELNLEREYKPVNFMEIAYDESKNTRNTSFAVGIKIPIWTGNDVDIAKKRSAVLQAELERDAKRRQLDQEFHFYQAQLRDSLKKVDVLSNSAYSERIRAFQKMLRDKQSVGLNVSLTLEEEIIRFDIEKQEQILALLDNYTQWLHQVDAFTRFPKQAFLLGKINYE